MFIPKPFYVLSNIVNYGFQKCFPYCERNFFYVFDRFLNTLKNRCSVFVPIFAYSVPNSTPYLCKRVPERFKSFRNHARKHFRNGRKQCVPCKRHLFDPSGKRRDYILRKRFLDYRGNRIRERRKNLTRT